MNNWPFELWLGYAVRGLNIPPSEFWDMSISDWLVLTTRHTGKALSRCEFDALMKQHPDEVIT